MDKVIDTDKRAICKRSIVLAGHKTSVSLEDAFMTHLRGMAAHRGIKLATLIIDVDHRRDRRRINLSAALRLAVLADLQATIARLSPSLAPDTPNRSSVNAQKTSQKVDA